MYPANQAPMRSHASVESGDARRQYTLKGVEAEAIDLMRKAAQVKGVKIGHWVSERIKEAASKAIAESEGDHHLAAAVQTDFSDGFLDRSAENHCLELEDARVLRSRIYQLEDEVRELARTQREMLLLIASKRMAV